MFVIQHVYYTQVHMLFSVYKHPLVFKRGNYVTCKHANKLSWTWQNVHGHLDTTVDIVNKKAY